MHIRAFALVLALFLPAAAGFANPAVPVTEGATAATADKLPVGIVLSISDQILSMQREFRAQSFSGKRYDFQVNVGQKFSDAIENTVQSIYRDVYTTPTEGLPTIRFELADYDSNIALKDGPFSIEAKVSTLVGLRVIIMNAGAKTLLSTTAEGNATIARNVFFSGVGQGPMLVEETSMAAIDQALEKLSAVLRRNGSLNFYGTEQGNP